MAINQIKELAFRNFKATESEQLIKDGGGLFVRIRPIANGGGVSFRLAYRFEGKLKWADLKAKMLVDARAERDIYKALLKDKLDPKLEIKLQEERQRKKQLEEQEALAKLKARVTVRDLFTRWCEIALVDRRDTKEITRMFEKDVLPVIGDLFVEEVRKSHITQITDALLLRGVKRMAKMILALMRQMFRFAVDRDIIEFDPTASIRKAKIGGKDVERDRTLSELEIRALARQLPDANLLKSTECAIWIGLSTLCRIGELSKAKFSDLDFNAKTWTIPESNSKNGRAHTIYLSDFALQQFKTLKTIASSDTWIFPNRDNSSHVCDKSITKQIGGRQSEEIFSNRSKNNLALVLTGGKWTPHDLRRTGATIMGNLKIAPDVIEKCLNHTDENKVKRIYQRHELKAEQAEAWRLLGDRLSLLVNMDASNVVPMKKSA
jgi:integrase